MRRSVAVRLLAVVLILGFAGPSSALQVELRFDNDPAFPLTRYNVTAVGDTAWFAINFGLGGGPGFEFTSTPINPAFDLTLGLFVYNLDGLSSAGISYDMARTSGGFAPGVIVPLFTLAFAAAGRLGPPGIHELASLQGSALFEVSDGVTATVNSQLCLDGTSCNTPEAGILKVTITNVPEPTALALLALALSALAALPGRNA